MKNVLIKTVLLLIMINVSVFAAQTIHGKYSMTCFDHDSAERYAPKPSYAKIRNTLGCQKFAVNFKGADNCKQCSNGKYKCQGYVVAYCK